MASNPRQERLREPGQPEDAQIASLAASDLHKNKSPVNETVPPSPERKRERTPDPDILPAPKRTKTPRPTSNCGVKKPAKCNPTLFWIQNRTWPKDLFIPSSSSSEYLGEGWKMHRQPSKSCSSASPCRKCSQSDVYQSTPSDQKPREQKSTAYQDPRYPLLMELNGSYMKISKLGVTSASESLCKTLLETEQETPENTLFQEDIFERVCQKIQGRNEAVIVQDISRLIRQSRLEQCIPFTSIPRPQPDYSVGFLRTAFSDDQLNKLQPHVGSIYSKSYYMGTFTMYFPFLACEVKCGSEAIEVADRQNTHTMTLAVRGIVELFRLVRREKELHQEILAFSVSHDDSRVRIYGHYALTNDAKTTYYRHLLHDFSFVVLEGKEKWTAYKFTKNIYDLWMPMHLKRICSVIDQLPSDIDFEVSEQSGLHFSENPQSLSATQTLNSVFGDQHDQGEDDVLHGSQPSTPIPPWPQPEAPAFKKPRALGI
ncbi:MAG: hypothetical protein M1829_003581 [Trizodia sp. TS-e1964]|nr:MAG: hypothetical protein M1829_003581 [Trizodia sp. TS-e1964]